MFKKRIKKGESTERAEDLEALLEKRSFIVGGLSNISQADLAQALAEEPAFSGYVLDTKHLGSLDDLVDMLDCHGSLFFKTLHGVGAPFGQLSAPVCHVLPGPARTQCR